jgi:hypothetical protein
VKRREKIGNGDGNGGRPGEMLKYTNAISEKLHRRTPSEPEEE